MPVTVLLRRLHWLPVKARIEYKVALLCHQCLYNNEVPSYLKDIIKPYADSLLLEVPRFSLTTVGLRAFSISGPNVWNQLPIKLRKTSSIGSFKKDLKTHYFNIYLRWHCFWTVSMLYYCCLVIFTSVLLCVIKMRSELTLCLLATLYKCYIYYYYYLEHKVDV